MSPRHLIPLTLVAALAAGAVTAVAIDDSDDDARTIAISGKVAPSSDPATARVDLSGVTRFNDPIVGTIAADRPSLDTVLAKGRKLTFNVESTSPSGDETVLRGRVQRSRSGEITGRLDARP